MRPTTSALPNSAETPHPTPTPTATARSQRTRTESQRQRSTQERLRRGGRRIDAAHPQPRRRPQRSPVPVAAPPSTVQGAITSVAVNTRFGPPPPSKEPCQRPFPRNREGPLTMSEVLGANRSRTRLTFGTQPDGHGRFHACPGCGEFNEVWRSCRFVTLSTASARSTAHLLSREVRSEVRQTVRRFSDRHVILAAVRTQVIKGRGGAWADGTAGTLCWRSVLVTRCTSLAVVQLMIRRGADESNPGPACDRSPSGGSGCFRVGRTRPG